ncbi:dystonin isoform X3 [Microcaecilia unicolor]|uniref:Dystonin isoform X3 n=1 Tax=Microcaecilia unicolor TaxID=1415580 RepID=A0A6P7XH79_9AMPH|nr:dystonin isoform X3 [Microcaecilia unicolor]
MNSTRFYGYNSNESLLSSSTRTSTRTSVGSNENLLSVNCGPTLINSCISFGSESSGESRLEMLQQIANRVQRDSLGCEDKLILARNCLQSDAKRLESGLQFQNETEIAGYLLECENLLRQQVIDVQMLLDGKYYQSEQLLQRVAKLRDELMALRNECSAVYSKGRTLSTEQTKLMISGITQSLNSGFQQNLNPTLNSSLTQSFTPSLTPSSLTAGLSHGFTPRLTSVITPAFTTPGLIQNYVTGVAPGALQSLKLMQIRKPLMKSAIADQNLTEEEVNIRFVQDLLSWVEEMQVQLDRAEWGSDLPSVEGHLEDHKNVCRAVEEFESSLKEAMISEIQMTGAHKLSYSEKLRKLESQYAKLLNTTRNRERHLDTLHNFVSRATRELIWLNEKEEEEVAYDWSERNPNISRKKEYHAELMRELDQKEDMMKAVQDMADQLLLDNHPARLTIEAYRAAMQTQWSWILQLCHCVEQHLRENAAYFEFFNDTKESMDYLKNLKDTIQRKYSCGKTSSLHKLEDLVQESMEEKEQLLQYKSTVAGLVGRAKAIIQLKPRNPDSPLKASIPIKAICDYKQIEITIYKDDECILASNSHRAKWKVINPTGNEAMVPSVCFTVPPPNKEALDAGNRIEQLFQSVLARWHESHINMKSVVSWHYLMNEIDTIRASNVASIKTMLPGEHQQVLSNLKSRFEDFLEDSQESKIFSGTDIRQLERDVNVCKQCYEELLKSAEREEQEESVFNLYVSEVRNILLRLENCEERLIKQIRTPVERDDLHESVFNIAEQEKLKKELDRLKEDLGETTKKCEEFFSQAAAAPSVPTLRSELNAVVQNMNQVYSLSSIYLEKLKTINLLLKNTQAAELLVKLYETKLCEEDAVTADKNAIDTLVGTLKQWRLEVDEKREVFHVLEDELQKAKTISDQMFKVHKERDLDFDWHREKADQLADRWQNVHSQIDSRLRDLDGISKSLKYYRETYLELDDWIKQAEETQRKIQEEQPANSKALAKQLDQQKMLVSEIEMKQNKIDECQKYSEQYSAALKDYELQLMMYRAMVDSHQKSPVKRRRMQNSSDLIIQEFMDLRTRYTALVTLMTQYVKFAGESLKRMEEEEIRKVKEASASAAYPDLLEQQKTSAVETKKLMEKIHELEKRLDEVKKQKQLVEQELPRVKASAESELKKQQKIIDDISFQKTKAEYESNQFRIELENTVKQKASAEQQLEHVKQLTLQAEAKRTAVEDKLRVFRTQIEESTISRRKLEEHLKKKDTNLQDLENQKNTLMGELRKKAEIEEELLKQIKQMEQDLEFQRMLSETQLQDKIEVGSRRQISEARYSLNMNTETLLPTRTSAHEVYYKIDSQIKGFPNDQDLQKIEVLQQQIDELTEAKRKAEKEIKELKLEVNSVQLQKTEAEEKAYQLKNQLEDTNNKMKQMNVESEYKTLTEQSYMLQLRGLDRKEVTDFEIKMNFQEELQSLQQEKLSLGQKIQMQTTELIDLREKVKTQQEQLLQREKSDQSSHQKILFMEEEIAKKKNEVGELKRKVDEFTRSQTKAEINIKNLNSEISSFRQEKMTMVQRTQSYKGDADGLREQLKKSNEQLVHCRKAEKEHEQQIQKLQVDLEKSNKWSETLKEKLEELTKLNNETDTLVRKIKSDSEKVAIEKNTIQQNNNVLQAQLDTFKEQLRITREQLQMQTKTEQELQNKVYRFEEDLRKSQNVASEFKQKYDKQSVVILTSEKEIRNLKADLNSSAVEKKMSEQKFQLHENQLQELNNKLKKTQEELQKRVIEEQLTQKKVLLLQEDSLRYKQSADEFRKKLEKMMESSLTSEKDVTQLKLEFVTVQQDRSIAEEKVKLHQIEIADLQERIKRCREQMQQGKQTETDLSQKCRKLEEELEVQKRIVENLKHRVDLQRKGHIHQLQLLQNEIQQNSNMTSPLLRLDLQKANEFKYSPVSSPCDFGQFFEGPMKSPVMRRKLETQKETSVPLFKSERTEEKKVQIDGNCPEELQFHLSRMKQSREDSENKPSFAEYVSQTSSEVQISVDDVDRFRRLSEFETIREKNLQSARRALRDQEENLEKELLKLELPLERMKNKQFDLLVEVTTVKQEKEILLNNENGMLEEHKLEFGREDLPKMKYMFLEQKNCRDSDKVSHNYSSVDDQFKFQGLRHQVTARQLAEAKLLDIKTMEQLQLGLKSVQEIQRALDRLLSRPTAIAGLYLDSSKERLSFSSAARKKIIEKIIAFEFLEAQSETGFIIDPATGFKYSVEEAVFKGIVDVEFKDKLLAAEKAVLGYFHSGKLMSVFQAMEARLLEKQKGKRILEAQIATGGVIDPVRSIRVPSDAAVQQGLLNHTILKFLYEHASNAKGFHHPDNMQAMYYYELLKMCVFDVDSKCYLLPLGKRKISSFSTEKAHKISVVDIKIGAEMSKYEAYEKGLVDKCMYLELSDLECNWEESTLFDSSGNSSCLLTDLISGRQFNIDEELAQGTIDKTLVSKYRDNIITITELADILLSRSKTKKDLNSPIAGCWIANTNERISIFKALRRNLVDRITAVRCLEAQACTGGILDPSTGKRFCVAEAVSKELIDQVNAKEIQQCELAFTGLIHPVTKNIVPAAEAMSMNMLNKDIGIRSLEFQYVTGGLIDPKSHSRWSLEDAIRKGIVDAITATKLKDEKSYLKSLTCPKTRRKLSYKEALENTVFDCHTGLRLLEANLPLGTGISSLYFAS